METITVNDLVRLAVIIAGLWGFFKVVNEIVKAANDRHDREQKWDDTADTLRKERNADVCRYDAQLADIRRSQEDIRTEFDAKVQEIKSEQLIIVECLRAVLDGLHQQGCNGKVSEAINLLDGHIVEKAYKS